MRNKENILFHDLNETKKELSKTKKTLSQLEGLVAWIQDKCFRCHAQFCGIHKITLDSGSTRYVGFALEAENSSDVRQNYQYNLIGYISNPLGNEPEIIYKAFLEQDYSEFLPVHITNILFITDNYVTEKSMERKGIGSAAMTAIKNLAWQLHCSEITGNRIPRDDTEESKISLWNFYEKIGFAQKPDTMHISYDMSGYEPENTLLS